MSAQALSLLSEEEYLVRERSSIARHEYYNGRIYAMIGGTEPHNLIASNMIATLHSQLRRSPGRIYGSDMRIKVRATGLNTYPDVSMVCGQPEFTDATRDTLTNPIVLIEVLSPSTERYDRGLKFQNYRTIETLQDYLLLAQNRVHIEHYVRQGIDERLLHKATSLDATLIMESINCTLALSDVYEKVDFEQSDGGLPRD